MTDKKQPGQRRAKKVVQRRKKKEAAAKLSNTDALPKGTIRHLEPGEENPAMFLYIKCKNPLTGENQVIKTSRKVRQVITDLFETGNAYPVDGDDVQAPFLEQTIEVFGYRAQADEKTKVVTLIPYTLAKGKTPDVIMEVGKYMIRKEDAVQRIRQQLANIMEQSDISCVNFTAVFETPEDGVCVSGETIVDPVIAPKPSHFIVLDNAIEGGRQIPWPRVRLRT